MRVASLNSPTALRRELRGLHGKARDPNKEGERLPDKKGQASKWTRLLNDPVDPSRATFVVDDRGGHKATVIGFIPGRYQAMLDAYMQYRGQKKRGPGRPSHNKPPASGALPLPNKPPTPDAPPLSGKPPASDVGGLNKPPAFDDINPLRQTHPYPFPLSGKKDNSADAPSLPFDADATDEAGAKPNGVHHPNGSGNHETGSVSPATRKRGAAPAAAGPTQAEIDADFEAWWQHYPRKEDKIDAAKAYAAARKRGATAEQLLEAAKRYRPAERKYTKLPATWLNKGSWLNGGSAAAEPSPDQEQARARLKADIDELRAQEEEARKWRQ